MNVDIATGTRISCVHCSLLYADDWLTARCNVTDASPHSGAEEEEKADSDDNEEVTAEVVVDEKANDDDDDNDSSKPQKTVTIKESKKTEGEKLPPSTKREETVESGKKQKPADTKSSTAKTTTSRSSKVTDKKTVSTSKETGKSDKSGKAKPVKDGNGKTTGKSKTAKSDQDWYPETDVAAAAAHEEKVITFDTCKKCSHSQIQWLCDFNNENVSFLWKSLFVTNTNPSLSLGPVCKMSYIFDVIIRVVSVRTMIGDQWASRV